jgi:hypothetical protein
MAPPSTQFPITHPEPISKQHQGVGVERQPLVRRLNEKAAPESAASHIQQPSFFDRQ